MAETNRFVLSNYGIRYFLEDVPAGGGVPTAGTHEVISVLEANIGSFKKDSKAYRTLNGDGWESIAPLGQSQDEATIQCLRYGEGDVYDGTDGTTTFCRVRKWMMDATRAGGSTAQKVLVEVVPRGKVSGEVVYEGTAYYVIPTSWNPSARNSENGQEFNFTVKPFGAPVPLTVTATNGQFTFAPVGSASAGGGDSVIEDPEEH